MNSFFFRTNVKLYLLRNNQTKNMQSRHGCLSKQKQINWPNKFIVPFISSMIYIFRYLPPYTSFLPVKDDESPSIEEKEGNGRRKLLQSLVFSQLSYLVIFITLICIIERKAMTEDPLNFNVFNIVFEVIRQVFTILSARCSWALLWMAFKYSWKKISKVDNNLHGQTPEAHHLNKQG